MIPVFVISLPDITERRNSVSGILDRLNIPFEFVDAVDGRQGLDPQWEPTIKRGIRLSLGQMMIETEYACALSHIPVYRRIVDEGIAHALILEDDALPTADMKRFLEEGHYELADLMQLLHAKAKVRRFSSVELFSGYKAYHYNHRPAALAGAYTLSRRGAEHILHHALPVRHSADWPECVHELCLQRQAMVVHPCLVNLLDTVSTIDPTHFRFSRPKRRLFGIAVPPPRAMARSWMASLNPAVKKLPWSF